MQTSALPERLAARAEDIVNTVTDTTYQHVSQIDADTGVYDCDCNGFVAYLLETLAPAHYAKLPKEPTQIRPRAFEYYDFFSSLTPTSPGGWHRIEFMADARRGDILAWRFPLIEKGHDTGHVVFLAETPTLLDDNKAKVRVYDSAATPHFEDTRGPGDDEFATGVGSGFINFELDSDGRPIAFQFAPGDHFETQPIAIGRAEPLSS